MAESLGAPSSTMAPVGGGTRTAEEALLGTIRVPRRLDPGTPAEDPSRIPPLSLLGPTARRLFPFVVQGHGVDRG